MSSEVHSFFVAAAAVGGLLFLTACMPDMSMLDIQEKLVNTPPEKDLKSGAEQNPPPAENAAIPASFIPPFTPALYCRAGRGSAFFGDDWYDFSDTSFTMYKGGKVNIQIPRRRHMDVMQIQAIFDSTGQKMVFCPLTRDALGEQVSCSSLYTLEEDLKTGIKRTFDVPDAVRGGTISCSYKKESIRSLVTPAGGGD